MTGGVRGFGNYINSYGDSIKNSMAADGPVSHTAKKAPMNANAGKGTPVSAPRASLSGDGAKKSVPTASSPKPGLQASKPSGKTTKLAAPSGQNQINPQSRPKPTAGVVRAPNSSPQSKPPVKTSGGANIKAPNKPPSNGKVRISPESRPKLAVKK